jgi:hypothetical protein
MVKSLMVSLMLVAVLGGALGCQSSDSESPASSAALPNQLNAVSTPSISQADKDKAMNKAIQASGTWLKFLDEGKCGAGWDQTGDLLKQSSPKDAWCKQVAPLRAALGGVLSRKVNEADYRTQIEKGPEGQYVVIHYDTSFRATDHGTEQVTAALGKDGTWRPVGYYVSVTPPTPAAH